ncbi:MAG: hypothetical protein HON92_08095, partial [Planctomycetaceae bacterium]|nr:hypothetical protein [Planctomycetaceae bacterium]
VMRNFYVANITGMDSITPTSFGSNGVSDNIVGDLYVSNWPFVGCHEYADGHLVDA